MSFIGTKNLTTLLEDTNLKVIFPFDEERIKNGAYELSLGSQVFQTDSTPRVVKNLSKNEKINIAPGQFALLLTEEYLKIPENRIAFISIKAGVKFKGLVNVSGFHVDPGFEGKLLFSVYNAGPSSIILSQGTPYFPIWFAELNESQKYEGSHEKQNKIPDSPVESLSQGELASPNILSKRIDEVKSLKISNDWFLKTIIGLSLAISLKLFWDWNQYHIGFKEGYEKKVNELVSDSTAKEIQKNFTSLKLELDSLKKSKKEVEKAHQN
jgi:dCTP deaminase